MFHLTSRACGKRLFRRVLSTPRHVEAAGRFASLLPAGQTIQNNLRSSMNEYIHKRYGVTLSKPPEGPLAASRDTDSKLDLQSLRKHPELYGRIHSLESFTTTDGPGIRFMIFAQGCLYRCIFCCNPDSWSRVGGTITSVEDLVHEIRNCYPYLKPNRGGVTISGGDPMVQPKFVANLFKEVHKIGLTTCIDTTGYGSKEDWDTVLPHTDFVLLCVKHPNPDKYEKISGKHDGYQTMLKFLKEVENRKIDITIRYVFIPNMTDSIEDLDEICSFVKSHCPTLVQIELLPYHRLGEYKYEALGLPYPMEGTQTPTKESVQKAKEYIESQGIKCLL